MIDNHNKDYFPMLIVVHIVSGCKILRQDELDLNV